VFQFGLASNRLRSQRQTAISIIDCVWLDTKTESCLRPKLAPMPAAWSEGIPRKINNLCFNALSLGYAKRQRSIDASIVQEAVRDLSLDSLGSDRLTNQNEARDSGVTSHYLNTPGEAASNVTSSDMWRSEVAGSFSRLPKPSVRGLGFSFPPITWEFFAFFICFLCTRFLGQRGACAKD